MWYSYIHLHSTYSFQSIFTTYLWRKHLVNCKAQWQTALLLTHSKTIKAKEHRSAMEPEWKKERKKRRMRACNEMGFSFYVSLSSRTGPDIYVSVNFQSDIWIFPCKPATEIFQISELEKWSYVISEDKFSSQLCSFHIQTQQNYSMWQWGEKLVCIFMVASVTFSFMS